MSLSIIKYIATLTNTQIKALPTTPITLIVAPGSGFYIRPISVSFRTNFSAGAYTNVDTTDSSVAIQSAGGSWLVSPLSNDSVNSVADVSHFFAATNTITPLLVPLTFPNGGGGWQIYSDPLTLVADVDNKALQIAMGNNGSGDLTGGNSANTLKITVYYIIEAL